MKSRSVSKAIILLSFLLSAVLKISTLTILLMALLLIIVWGLFKLFPVKDIRRGNFFEKTLWKDLCLWILFVFVLSLPALVVVPGSLDFIFKGMFSGFISFGGGTAYLSVADGIFVHGN